MHHEVKEMGKHMYGFDMLLCRYCFSWSLVASNFKLNLYRLIVTLSYSVPSVTTVEPIMLERYFKFQVKKPLDVKTKLYNAEVS
jgi:hypothetical protein